MATHPADSPLKETAGGVMVEVLASAGSSASKVRGLHGGALKVAVRAAPEKGKANAEIAGVLAKFFGVSKNSAAVVAGETSRNKCVLIQGITLQAAQARLNSFDGNKQPGG
jgi:uncharacterized protein (TIGR00251 family)